MPVNDGYIKFHNGEITEGFNYYIDESNRVYEYDYLYDCAAEVDARAFNGNGINLRFKLNKAEFICVI